MHPEGFALADEWPSREVWPCDIRFQLASDRHAGLRCRPKPSSASHAATWFQLVKMRLTNLRSGLGRGKAEGFPGQPCSGTLERR